MKKLYEEPFFDITKLSFQDMMVVDRSEAETGGTDQGGEVIDPWAIDVG